MMKECVAVFLMLPLWHTNSTMSGCTVNLFVMLQLEAKLRLVPGKLESTEDELRNHQSSYNSMVELRPIKDSVRNISSQIVHHFLCILRAFCMVQMVLIYYCVYIPIYTYSLKWKHHTRHSTK